jgi:hypothetical protein
MWGGDLRQRARRERERRSKLKEKRIDPQMTQMDADGRAKMQIRKPGDRE